ncbi:hypothetical protein [Nocardia africana]|uniref:Uncharacterized protein n=1 Tax=Nocardia africana TaxID=134964 RepID=A0A378X0X7_9NOCA|nr:hypothetical protein [Nocardia africana]MCC3311483.1 hypothetical protein [Nocardia africana]SUA47256.1 Uncharacterised protein [Nocardia africana]
MGRHHNVSRWRRMLRRITGRRPAQHVFDPGTRLLPVITTEPYEPPTVELPVYTPEVPSC